MIVKVKHLKRRMIEIPPAENEKMEKQKLRNDNSRTTIENVIHYDAFDVMVRDSSVFYSQSHYLHDIIFIHHCLLSDLELKVLVLWWNINIYDRMHVVTTQGHKGAQYTIRYTRH